MKNHFCKVIITTIILSSDIAFAIGNERTKSYNCASPGTERKVSFGINPLKNVFILNGKETSRGVMVFGSFQDGALGVNSEGATSALDANIYHGDPDYDFIVARIHGKNYICQIHD